MLRCAVLLAVRCCAHLSNKLLTVARFVRCNDVGGALQPADSINQLQQRKGVGENLCTSCAASSAVRERTSAEIILVLCKQRVSKKV